MGFFFAHRQLRSILMGMALFLCATPSYSIDYLWFTEEEWKAELTHSSPYRERLAIAHFSVDGVLYDDLLPILVAKLKTRDERYRNSYELYEAIGNYRKRAEPHLPLLVDLLKFDYRQVYLAFSRIGRASIPPLNEMLDSGNEQWQLNVIQTFERMQLSQKNDRLYHWLNEGTDRVRAACAKAIWECYEDPAIATTLAELLESEDAFVSRIVPRLVGDMGIQAKAIEAEISDVLSRNSRIRGNYYLKKTLAEIQRQPTKQP